MRGRNVSRIVKGRVKNDSPGDDLVNMASAKPSPRRSSTLAQLAGKRSSAREGKEPMGMDGGAAYGWGCEEGGGQGSQWNRCGKRKGEERRRKHVCVKILKVATISGSQNTCSETN